MEPYLVCFFSGVISGWGATSLPDPSKFSSTDPMGLNVALIYKGKGRILLEILHYQFLLAAGLVILEIVLLPIKWYFTILCYVFGLISFYNFLRIYRGSSRGNSRFWRCIDLLVYDSPVAASLSFLGIICMIVLVIAKWWGKV